MEVGAPPGLSHAGENAMLSTKSNFEDVGLPPPSEVATTESGSRNGRSAADSSYASAVGSPIGDYEAMDAEDGNGRGKGGVAVFTCYCCCCFFPFCVVVV